MKKALLFKSITSKHSARGNVQIHYRVYTEELRNKCIIGSSLNGNNKQNKKYLS